MDGTGTEPGGQPEQRPTSNTIKPRVHYVIASFVTTIVCNPLRYDITVCFVISLLKPTVYMKNHQFNIQQLYALPTLYLCVLYLSENKQRLVPLTT